MSVSPGVAIFDLDGTLTESGPGIVRSARYALARFNELHRLEIPVPAEEDLRWLVGPPLRESFARLVGADQAEAVLNLYRERYGKIGLYENSVYAGIPAALEALLTAGDRLFVATSKPEAYARRILAHFDLTKYFREIYGAQTSGANENKRELLTFLLGRERIAPDPNRVVMIGDRSFDCAGAIGAGVSIIGALWGYGGLDELRSAGADPIIAVPSQIPAAVRAVFSRQARKRA